MRLTRVEIHGFKSFADPVVLELPPGLTAVVGPNGCGKSNVIDAIKWALGEQRASALRGDEMLDVIFKGNGARAARNFAEVSLVFDNAGRTLPIDFQEVVVTRRLFRSGESEYLINRQPQRLKDVRNLFMDTGLGTGAYSIMEQGRIDAVLSADARDRRRIFEEAAGISRYRARRRESEGKLERAEQNLLRLGDIVEELEKQSRSLKQQAGRARSYLAVRDRLAALKARFYVHRWQELGRTAEHLADTGSAAAAAEAEARAVLAAARNQQALLASQLTELRAAADAAADSFRSATSAAEALAGRRAGLVERRAEALRRIAQLGDRVEALAAALAARRTELAGQAERLAELAAGLQAADGAVAAREFSATAADREVAAFREACEQRRRGAVARLGELTEWRNRRVEAANRHAAAAASCARIADRVAALQADLSQHTTLQGQLFVGAQGVDQALAVAAAETAEVRGARGVAQAELAALETALGDQREKLAAVESRRVALEELIARHEGLSAGARRLLDAKLPGVVGLVIEQLRAPRGLAVAVEAALGTGTEAVLVEDRAAALAALAWLEENGGGRVLLLPRADLQPRHGAAGGERLLDRLAVRGETAALEALLGHVRLLAERAELAAVPLDGATAWVTARGDLLDERGVLRGGRQGNEVGPVARQSECDALGVETEGLRTRLAELVSARRAAEAALAAADLRLQSCEASVRRLEAERERMAEAERQGAARVDALKREVQIHGADLTALQREQAELEQARDEAARRETELETAVARDGAEERSAESERERREQVLGAARAALHEARLAAGTLRERHQAQRAELAQVERAAQERAAEERTAREERSELQGTGEALAAELADAELRERELGEQRDTLAGELEAARRAVAAVQAALAGHQQELDHREAQAAVAAEAVAEQRLAAQETAIHRETLREKVLDELAVDLAEGLPAEWLQLGTAAALSDAEPEGEASPDTADADARSLPEAAAAASAAAELDESDAELPDWGAVEAEIDELRARLARMGNVNLAAVDELRDVEERLSFLVSQRDDLLAARAALLDTISTVNKESRDRFAQTFEEVREHFRAIFRKLFRGGKADIFLTEGEDLLEAGIEIVAAPPGKDARSISLLSGGERTLTAVGLLFALFRARPSPVCMLDEVDAALDETNIDRFCTVLEDFLGASQFLVVTHARRTMSYADTLYGITMQEHGVSRALSLSLREYDEHGLSRSETADTRKHPAAGRPRPAVERATAELLAEGGNAADLGAG